jgi:hypothetical protein
MVCSWAVSQRTILGKGIPTMPNNRETLTIVVNGNPVVIEVNLNAPLRTVIEKALHESGNNGQPPQNWELRSEGGELLDLSQKIGEYNFPETIKLFLNLKAGIGG